MLPLLLWGKSETERDPQHLLEYHLIDTAETCEVLLFCDKRLLGSISDGFCCSEESVICLMRYLCSIHDIGKTSYRFQRPEPERLIKYRHDLGGYQLCINNLFKQCSYPIVGDNPSFAMQRKVRTLLCAALMHHGSPKGCNTDSFIISENFDKSSLDNACSLLDHMIDLYGDLPEVITIFQSSHFDRITNLVAGIITFSDWIASSDFDHVDSLMPLEDYRKISRDRARNIFNSDLRSILKKASEYTSFANVFGYEPTPVQEVMGGDVLPVTGPFMCIVEDATGSGKTEASLALALRTMMCTNIDGISFALPTRTTSDLMYSRLKSYASAILDPEASVSLQHATSRTYLKNNGESVDSWISGKNKALFANMAVCTVDQLLGSVIPVRFQPLKLASSIRHVLIIDEVHAYDSFTFSLICALVDYCRRYGIPIILLSATLPTTMRQMLVSSYGFSEHINPGPYPLITYCTDVIQELPCKFSERSRRTISLVYTTDRDAIRDEMEDLAQSGYRVCWIRNTVDDAIEAYESFNGIGYEKLLLHSRFILNDRSEIEKRLFSLCGKGAFSEGLVVISTQVVEQSLDIEFDRMFSDLAPIDSLIQRMGRDQRFGDSELECRFIVHGPDPDINIGSDWYGSFFKRASFVYQDQYVLHRTAELMIESSISIPGDYRRMVEYAYSEPDPSDPFYSSHEAVHKKSKLSALEANSEVLNPDVGYGRSKDPDYIDDLWEAYDNITTREDDGRTVQCVLVTRVGTGYRPLSGDPETSMVALKRNAVGDCEAYGEGRWSFVRRVIMDESVSDDGSLCWTYGGRIIYTKERGAEYVQSDRRGMDSSSLQVWNREKDSTVANCRRYRFSGIVGISETRIEHGRDAVPYRLGPGSLDAK